MSSIRDPYKIRVLPNIKKLRYCVIFPIGIIILLFICIIIIHSNLKEMLIEKSSRFVTIFIDLSTIL